MLHIVINIRGGKNQNNEKQIHTFEEYGIDNCFITLIESYPCSSKDELASREAYYIKSMTCVNKVVPRGRQYIKSNNPLEYYNNNKDLLNVKFTCACGVHIVERHKGKHLKTFKHQQFINQNQN